jgi:shikimate dehydrogenase
MVRIDGKTEVICIIGNPVEHSFSPVMHNAAFESLGLNCCYLPFRVESDKLPDALNGIRALNIRGANVTVPHKQAVIPLLDSIDKEAEFIGAVNTVKNDNGTLKGYNTDGRGFIESLKVAGIETQSRKILVLGAGGASRAVSYYLSQTASELFIHNRNRSKGMDLVNDLKGLGGNVSFMEDLRDASSAEILINATSLGLRPDDPLPVNPEILSPGQTVCDLIYWETPLLAGARKRGCRTLDGMGMLLYQGVLAFRIWTGLTPPVDLMRKVLRDEVERKRR